MRSVSLKIQPKILPCVETIKNDLNVNFDRKINDEIPYIFSKTLVSLKNFDFALHKLIISKFY